MKFHVGQKVKLNNIDYMEVVRNHFGDETIDYTSVFEVKSLYPAIVSVTYKGGPTGGLPTSDLKPVSRIRRH